MAQEPLRSLLRSLRRLGECSGRTLTDAELLERFVRQRDEAAFEVLVWRHGPLVLGVCQRLLHREQDIEDTFQATFLALVRRAHTIVRREAVAAWLYRVAYRVALAARKAGADRAAKELPWTDQRTTGDKDELLWRDLRPILDAEIMRLPEKYRAPFVLCCLEGKTNEEAAALLGCPRGTVLSRLARARERLRLRLIRRGVTLSAVALTTVTVESGLAAVPVGLAELTIRAVPASTAGVVAAGVSAHVAALAEGVLRVMFLTRLKTVLLVVAILAVTGVGAGFLGAAMQPDGNAGAPQAGATAPKSQGPAGAPAADGKKANPVTEAQLRIKSASNLKQIGLALHVYLDTYKAFPAPAIYSGKPEGRQRNGPKDAFEGAAAAGLPGGGGAGAGLPGKRPVGNFVRVDGRPVLSWRVAILPYVGEVGLYKQFKLDEPWDSPHNKKLLARVPRVYAPVRGPSKVEGGTYYQAFVGKGAGFEPHKKLRIASFPDGTSNTIVVVEAGQPVPWTKPEDLPYVKDQALPQFGGQFHGNFFALFADGWVKLISRNADQEMLRRAITRDDGSPIDFDKVVAPQVRKGKVDLELLPEEVQRLKQALKKARAELKQVRDEVATLKAQKTPAVVTTSKLLQEYLELRDALDRTVQELHALKREADLLRGKRPARKPMR